MRVYVDNLKACLDKVKEIVDIYTLNHIATDNHRRHAQNLHVTCEAYINKKITLKKLEVPGGTAVKGIMMVFDDHYEIIVARDLNYCWERLVFCKELFHVLLDEEEARNMSLIEHVEAYTVEFPIVREGHELPPSVESEFLAEIAAMEFLFPYKARLIELQGPTKDDSLAIAEKYKVPRVLVEKYMSDNFMEILKKFCET